jgi:hypothetical protein
MLTPECPRLIDRYLQIYDGGRGLSKRAAYVASRWQLGLSDAATQRLDELLWTAEAATRLYLGEGRRNEKPAQEHAGRPLNSLWSPVFDSPRPFHFIGQHAG